MQSKCTWLGIGVELPPALTQACKEINTEILKINPQSYKFSQNTRPHLNLYDLDVPENNASEITSSLRNILKTVSSFEVKILKIGYFHFGAIFFEIEKNPCSQGFQILGSFYIFQLFLCRRKRVPFLNNLILYNKGYLKFN
jgi:hypothetical protein